MTKCAYLGHVVGSGCITPEESKVQAVKDFPKPSTKWQVRAFLGLVGYYWCFIPGYTNLATLLMDLTRKIAPNQVCWTKNCEKSYVQLKEVLCTYTILKSPDFAKGVVLQADASDRGIKVVLSQLDTEGTDRPITYYSKKLLPREEHYSMIENVCLATTLALQAFRVYLLGRPFTNSNRSSSPTLVG